MPPFFMAQPSGPHKPFLSIKQQSLLLWPLLSLLIPFWPGFSPPPPRRQLLNQELSLPSTGEVRFSKTFVVEKEAVGAVRLFAWVGLPVNAAVSISTELLDATDQVVLAFDKEGWREKGIWQEEGQTGTYDESDSSYQVLFRPNNSGQYRLRFAVDGLEDQAGQPLKAFLPLRVDIQDHYIDQGLSTWTFWMSLAVVLLFLNSVYCQGRRRFGGRIDDLLEASSFTRMNYERGVIMLKLKGRFELTTSQYTPERQIPLPLDLDITDGNGKVLYTEKINIYLKNKSSADEDDPPYWAFQSRLFFFNPKLQSLRFRLSMPEQISSLEQEWIDVDLRDRVVSMLPLTIRRIQ